MKKLFIILAILFIVFLIAFVSCKKVNLLAPSYIPQETKFRFPTDTIPKSIDVNPQPAKDGEVFGGFERKFRYKNKWYIMANYSFYYDAKTKTLSRSSDGYNILLELDDNGNLSVYSRNIDYYSWQHLQNMNIIDENQVWYQDSGIQSGYGIYDIYYKYLEGIGRGSIQIQLYSNNLSYHSYNLVNWFTNGKRDNIAMNFPTDNTDEWHSQGLYIPYHNVYFKGKLYVLGGARGWYGYNAERNFHTVKAIDYGSSSSTKSSSWMHFTNHWGKQSYIGVYLDADKLYVQHLGYYYFYVVSSTSDKITYGHGVQPNTTQPIYSTTGVTNKSVPTSYDKNGNPTAYKTIQTLEWKTEAVIPQTAKEVSYYNAYYAGPTVTPHPTTPNPPDWVIDSENKYYYKSASTSYGRTYINGRYYYLPIPPKNEIIEALNRGETKFTITEKHIENLGKNQFMLSSENPNDTKDSDWKLITPLEYTGYSMVWQIGANNMIFNLNGKIFQLMDYSKVEELLTSASEYYQAINELKKIGREHRERAETYNSKYYYEQAMYYETQADMLELILKNENVEVIKPDEAITHYEIKFRNH